MNSDHLSLSVPCGSNTALISHIQPKIAQYSHPIGQNIIHAKVPVPGHLLADFYQNPKGQQTHRQLDQKDFKQQREATEPATPGWRDQTRLIITPINSWNPGVQIAFVLEEIHMPPLLTNGVVCLVFLAGGIFWIFESCSPLEVDENIQSRVLYIESQGLNVSGGGDAKSCLKEVFHGRLTVDSTTEKQSG